MKLASRFATKVEVLTAFVVLAPVEEVTVGPPSPHIADHPEVANRKRDQELIKPFYREWGGTAGLRERWCNDMVGLPCLRIMDPRVGEVVIETSGSGLLLDTEETMSFSGLTFDNFYARASLPQWSNYEQAVLDEPEALPYPFPDKGHLTYFFVDRKGMKKSNISYRTCDKWANPVHARRVIQSIYDYCSNSEQYSETLSGA
jgi:hypothetical protein